MSTKSKQSMTKKGISKAFILYLVLVLFDPGKHLAFQSFLVFLIWQTTTITHRVAEVVCLQALVDV